MWADDAEASQYVNVKRVTTIENSTGKKNTKEVIILLYPRGSQSDADTSETHLAPGVDDSNKVGHNVTMSDDWLSAPERPHKVSEMTLNQQNGMVEWSPDTEELYIVFCG